MLNNVMLISHYIIRCGFNFQNIESRKKLWLHLYIAFLICQIPFLNVVTVSLIS